MRTDHRESVSERDHDPCLHARQGFRQYHVPRDINQVSPTRVVMPVDPEEVARIGCVRISTGNLRRLGSEMSNRVGKFHDPWQDDTLVAQLPYVAFMGRTIDNSCFQTRYHPRTFRSPLDIPRPSEASACHGTCSSQSELSRVRGLNSSAPCGQGAATLCDTDFTID